MHSAHCICILLNLIQIFFYGDEFGLYFVSAGSNLYFQYIITFYQKHVLQTVKISKISVLAEGIKNECILYLLEPIGSFRIEQSHKRRSVIQKHLFWKLYSNFCNFSVHMKKYFQVDLENIRTFAIEGTGGVWIALTHVNISFSLGDIYVAIFL